MMRRIFLLGALATAACSTTNPDGAEQTENEIANCEVAAVPDGAHGDVLFQQHPATGKFTTSKGVEAAIPLHVFDDDVLVVYGAIDASKIGPLFEGTGYAPLRLPDGRAAARLYFQNYHDTAIGAYRELVVGIEAGPAGGALALDYVNPYSMILPAMYPQNTLFVYKLALDSEVAIDYGRELLGLDKASGTLGACRSDGANNVFVADPKGSAVLIARVAEDDSPAAQYAFLTGLAAAMHLSGPEQLPPFPEINVMTTATRDVMASGVKKHAYTYRSPAPFYTPWQATDTLSFGENSMLGRYLGALHFEPKLVYRDKHLRFSVELAK